MSDATAPRSNLRAGWGVVLLAAVLGVSMIGVTRWLFFGLDEAVPWDKPAVVSGTEVQLTYTGQECRDRVQVDVVERAAEVVITVHETRRSVVCRGDETTYDVSVDLDSPLRDRVLVDGACRLGGHADSPLCADGVATVVPSVGAASSASPGGTSTSNKEGAMLGKKNKNKVGKAADKGKAKKDKKLKKAKKDKLAKSKPGKAKNSAKKPIGRG